MNLDRIDRSKRPLSSSEITFTLPDIETHQLNNGLELYYCEKNDLPIINISLLVNSGSRFDPVKQKGMSNLMAMCIDEGAGKFNALQLADEFEMLGSQFSVYSDSDFSVISLQVLRENFIPALKLFGYVIIEPHFKENDFNRERKKILVRLQQAKVEPDYLADVSFEYFLFGKDCPYAFPVSGLESEIGNIQPESIRSFYQKKFTPTNSAMIVVGNMDWQSLHKELEEKFFNWEITSTIEQPDLNLKKSQRKIFIVNKPDSVQTEIRIGHLSSKRNEKDFFQKQLINLVLGGQFSSRLNLNLREQHGYTYGVNSRFNYLKETGYFLVTTSVDTESTANALREIFSEIDKITEGISEEELRFAKSSLTRRFPLNFETYRQISSNISSKIIHNLPDDYLKTYIQKINSVGLDEVNSVASKAVRPDELITVLVGDSKKISKQIINEEFGERIVVDFDNVFN